MSTAKRLISGSAASWMRIGISVMAQLVLVPVYLTYWNVPTYGLWIAVQAFFSILTTMEFGHQTFLEFEFLKIGRKDPSKLSQVLWSGVLIGLLLGMVLIVLTLVIVQSDALPSFIGDKGEISASLMKDAGYVLIILTVTNLLTTNMAGIYTRALSPFGYFPRMSWWGVVGTIFITFGPLIAVINGASFLQAGIVLGAATVAHNIPQFIDMFRIFKKEKIFYTNASLSLGWKNFLLSMLLSIRELLENFRQQGMRVLLVPVLGMTNLTAFSTMRTGANVALQGLNTITHPLMPELMRFLHEKEQEKMEASFGTIWGILIVGLAPVMVLMQAIAEPLFHIWTKGRIAFNPSLFAMLSLSVLVYAFAQPAIAIVRGNNILKKQVYVSVTASLILITGIYTLVPMIGISGAGLSLLLSEVVACIIYMKLAKGWLSANALRWPERSSLLAMSSVFVAAILMAVMIWLPALKMLLVVIGSILFIWNGILYYYSLPLFIRNRTKNLFNWIKLTNYL